MARHGMRCLACGFLYDVAEHKHHCEHCYADTTYLRAHGRARLDRLAVPQDRSISHG